MQLILLSGGSGKRLWPLNNDGRSKQFLPLLASPTGGTESMLQRLVRQIRENLQTKDITVATNTAQRDNIINQLGNAINIVAETERRGTFPAIALASSFLEKEKGCDRDEVVVVMPCDVYTENSYFDIIKRMAEAVEANKADLVLMGVKPKTPAKNSDISCRKKTQRQAAKCRRWSCSSKSPTRRQRAAFSGWGLAGTLVSLPSGWAT